MSKSPAKVAKAMYDDEENLLRLKLLQRRSQHNPNDIDNLNSWAFSLLVRALHQSFDDALKTVQYALELVNFAADRDGSNNFTAWLFGKAVTMKAFLTLGTTDEAKPLFEFATKCFKQAVDEDPTCELFKYSLELSNKSAEIHLLLITKLKADQLIQATDQESSYAEGIADKECKLVYEYAREAAEKKLKSDPDDEEGIADKECKLVYEYLREAAEKKLKSDPDDEETLTSLAAHLLELSQYQSPSDSMGMVDDAIRKLNRALDFDPRNPYTYWLMGRTLTARALLTHDRCNGREFFGTATQFFKEAVTLDPHKNELFAYSLKQSEKHLEPGELEQLPAIGSSSSLKAACTKEESHDKDPEMHLLQVTKSKAGQRIAEGKSIAVKECKLAYEYLRKAAEKKMESDPDDVETLTSLAANLLELSQYQSPSDSMGMVDDAIRKLNRALDFDPRNPYTYWLMGRTLTARALLTHDRCNGREFFGTATQFFKEAVTLDPHKNELFAYSLKQSEKHLEPGELEQLPALGSSSSSLKAACTKIMNHLFAACTKEESLDRVLKKEKVTGQSEIIGWAPIAIGVVACMGVARYLPAA